MSFEGKESTPIVNEVFFFINAKVFLELFFLDFEVRYISPSVANEGTQLDP